MGPKLSIYQNRGPKLGKTKQAIKIVYFIK
jgi:hypothetical protein